jgi:hypothetical protein
MASFGPARRKYWVFAVVMDSVFDLAGQNFHDVDGIADYVGGALLAFRTSRYSKSLKETGERFGPAPLNGSLS